MTAIRFYFDADSMERAVISGLLSSGIDATTALEAGLQDASDEEQLQYANSQGRVLFTFNARDFHRIHTEYSLQGKSHAGIVLSPQQRYSIGERIRRLAIVVSTKPAEDIRNHIEFLSNWT
ncbi:MAG: DUF5615 family PIN-like protein [Pirellulales bacterium]